MENLQEIVNDLREIGALEVIEDNHNSASSCRLSDWEPKILPQAYWDEYYMTPPYWGPGTSQKIPITSVRPKIKDPEYTSFDPILRSLPSIEFDIVQAQALKDISSNTRDTTIIEIGSEYGNMGAGYLAKRLPNTRVILIDKVMDYIDEPQFLFNKDMNKIWGSEHILVFDTGEHLLQRPQSKDRIKQLYRANGIENIEFHKYELTPDNMNNFFNGLNINGDVYIFGHKNPGRLHFTTGLVYNHLNARSMAVSLTSQEKIKPNMFPWKIIQNKLGLNDRDLQGLIDHTYDPVATDHPEQGVTRKYDYTIDSERRFGMAVKLGSATALARLVNGNVFRNSYWDNRPNREPSYNQADYYVIANR